MSIVIVHDGPREHSLPLTSVVATIRKEAPDFPVTVITGEDNHPFFRYVEGVSVQPFEHKPIPECDLLIDYGGSDRAVQTALFMKPKVYKGLLPYPGTQSDINAFQGLYADVEVRRNVFQLLYGVAGLKWKGQGYGFRYYPRPKQRDGRVGAAIRNPEVRKFVRANLKVEDRLWHIPIRQNIYKQFDEVNVCEDVVTDDPFVMHVAVCLRKRVEYLVYEPPAIRPEFFGNGCVHLVPDEIRGTGSLST